MLRCTCCGTCCGVRLQASWGALPDSAAHLAHGEPLGAAVNLLQHAQTVHGSRGRSAESACHAACTRIRTISAFRV